MVSARRRTGLATLAALSLAAGPQAALGQPAPAPTPPGATAAIVVTAPENPDELPVQAASVAEAAAVSRAIGSDVDRFVRCTGLPEPRDLRLILDNGPADSLATNALHRFVVRNQGCYGTVATPIPLSPYFGACNPILVAPAANLALRVCRTTFDRGRLYELAVKTWGEEIALTRSRTFDRMVRARFLAREQAFDKTRVPMDKRYASVVGCMVQMAPEYARRLLQAAAGSAEETLARRLLIGNAGPCLGQASQVTADPSQFRAYTAEAVYAWLTAAGNRTTLVKG